MKKKLLILGGTKISLQILRAAKAMDIIVYVADYNEDSPCKKEADKSFLVSATDVDAIVKIIKEEHIDGVLMGYADVLLDSYVEICHKADIPCYATHKAIDITANKRKFKQYCRAHNIPVVEEYTYDDVENNNVTYPIIVKPVDNSGARGIFICNNKNEFILNYKKALDYSPSKSVIIERLMDEKEVTVFYYLHKGEIYLLGAGDRWMFEQEKDILKLPIGYTFPASGLEVFLEEENNSIKEMFKSLDMKEGMVFLQCFNENGKYIIYEMGYRLTGSLEHHLMREQYGFDHLKAIINYAVGNPVSTIEVSNIDPENCCMANVTILLNKGRIAKYEGIDKLHDKKGVIDYFLSYDENDRIDSDIIGKLSQVGIRILLTADNKKQLLERMDNVKDMVYALDDNNNDLFIKDYSYQTICQ